MEIPKRLAEGAPTVARAGEGCQPRLRHWVDSLLRSPQRCRLCTGTGQRTLPLCEACEAALPWLGEACPSCAAPQPAGQRCGACVGRPPRWSAAHATLHFAWPGDWLVRRLKFHGDLTLAPLLAGLMLRRPPPFLEARPVLAPVPLHWRRRLTRGYDQAAELTRALAWGLGRRSGMPLQPRLLARKRHTSPQVGLDAIARRRNLADSFRVRQRPRRPAVCLVDDVMTTGATAAACAEALLAEGVERVFVWCFARAAGAV